MSRDTQKVISITFHIEWGLTWVSRQSKGWVIYTCFRVFVVLGQFGETWTQCTIFLKLPNLTYGALNFPSRMGSIKTLLVKPFKRYC